MSITHAALSLTVTSIALGTANPWVMVAAGLGSQLPDLDSTESWFGRSLWPIAALIQSKFAHRTITHSFASTGIVLIAAAPLALIDWQLWAGVTIGQFMGWFADSFTKSGVAAFWPNPARLVIPGNPRVRLGTNTPAEYWVLSIACLLLICMLNINSNGGMSEQFELAFFSNSNTAADQFHKHGYRRTVSIDIEGININTSQSITGRFTVIEATAQDVIAESGETGKLYKIGAAPDVQIRPTKLKTSLGDAIKVTAEEAVLREISIGEWLDRLPPKAYISGSLLLEEMAEIKLQPELEAYPSVRAAGQLELSNARPGQLESLRDAWILRGKAIVKVRGT
ncbi:metal-dependent hydrolase [Phormidesmis sp. 146-12]